MADYRLSRKAEEDILRIADYGIRTYGVEIARDFRDGLSRHLAIIAGAPLTYPIVDELIAGYRRSIYRSLTIYYRIDGTEIFVARILGRQDPIAALNESLE
tara:strand:+ start:350 stop:652 length:303 start_codon:yes stop_codon:yes gene_type:complete